MNEESGHYSIWFSEQRFCFVKVFIRLLISKRGLEVILCSCENQTDAMACHAVQVLHTGFAKGRSSFKGVIHSFPPLQMGKSCFVAVCETLSLFLLLFVVFVAL